MHAIKLKTLIAAAAVSVIALGPAAGPALAEKPQAGPPDRAQASRYARGDDRSRGHDRRYDDHRRGGDDRYDDRRREERDRHYDSRRDDRRRYDDRGYDGRRGDSREYVRTVERRYAYYDARWPHRHAYPPRGYYYPRLPRDTVIVHYRDRRYYYGGGVWYAPRGGGWVVVAPPIGVFVSLLPAYYSTVWFGGIPYYYANDVYYVWRDRERAYEVVEPPPGAYTATSAPAVADIYVYPRQGQSPEQTDFDRYECHRWAADETGFDPTQPEGGVGAERARAARSEYLRAMTACLEGRGYSVR